MEYPSKKCVAIVCFERDLKNAEILDSLMQPYPRVVNYQVVLDPENVTNSGEYVRFGGNVGDEITGWLHLDDVVVLEVMAEWSDATGDFQLIPKSDSLKEQAA